MLRSINDLPSHVFFVHIPIIAIPVMSLLAIVMGVLKSPPTWLRRVVLVGTILTVIATWLAVQSGQEFDEIVGDRVDTGTHETLGNQTMLLSLGLALSVIGLSYVMRKLATLAADGAEASSGLGQGRVALAIATVLFAALSTVWVVRTGEEGVRLVWNGVIPAEGEG